MEKRGFFQNINFLEKTRLEKKHFFLEKTQPFFPLFFQKKTFIFVFFRAARGGIGKNPYVYVYVYVYIYVYRVSSLHRPSDEEETKPPSAVPLRGTAPGTFVFWENFPKKNFWKFLKTKFFLKKIFGKNFGKKVVL